LLMTIGKDGLLRIIGPGGRYRHRSAGPLGQTSGGGLGPGLSCSGPSTDRRCQYGGGRCVRSEGWLSIDGPA
jgi:hypothetical protein